MSSPEPAPINTKQNADESNDDYSTRLQEHFSSIKTFTVTTCESTGGGKLTVLSAPSSKEEDPWMFKKIAKQIKLGAGGKHLFRRQDDWSVERMQRTKVSLLTEKRGIMWTGDPGLGKSLSLIDLLIQLVRDLEPGQLFYVGLFRRGKLTLFCKANGGSVQVYEKPILFTDLVFSANALPDIIQKEHMILLVDPSKSKGDLDLNPVGPTLISISAQLPFGTMQRFFKS